MILIHAHPDQHSFNHAIAHTAEKRLMADGHEVYFHDLYAEGFDPIFPKGGAGLGRRAAGEHCRARSSTGIRRRNRHRSSQLVGAAASHRCGEFLNFREGDQNVSLRSRCLSLQFGSF